MKNIFFALTLMIIYTAAHSQEKDKYMFIFLNANPNKPELSKEKVDSLQEGHIANIRQLAKEGKLSVAGPFDGGGGIFILNTQSAVEAKTWISSDPAITAGRYHIEILPWVPRVGSVCTPPKDTEYVTYTFVRYNTFITKFNVRNAPELFRQHDNYLKEIESSGNVISEGVFDNSDGGTLVMKGEVQKAVIMNDPTVKNGIIEPEIKKIWVAKGSFCEN